MTTRRRFLGSLAAAAGAAFVWPHVTRATTGSDTRFLLVMLRGGLDGLHALAPYADPAYAHLRGALAQTPDAASKLDGTFALHPALGFVSTLYVQKQALPIVAVAPPYWGRSHFDAQDCLENGSATPHGAATGWLNRCVAALPGATALAATSVMPLAMRGSANVETWTPPLPKQIDAELLQRLEVLYAADPRLDEVFRRAIAASDDEDMKPLAPPVASTSPAATTAQADAMNADPRVANANNARLAQMMRACARFMAKPDGARIAFVEDTGWDTHANEAAVLARKLAELDAGLRAFHDGVGDAWSRTVVAVVTEFGRTAAVNGTGGTDHGSGGFALLAGGAVHGGRIAGDWPGLATSALYEGRDVHATTDVRAVFKGVLTVHLGVGESALETQIFPDSARVRMREDLVVARTSARA